MSSSSKTIDSLEIDIDTSDIDNSNDEGNSLHLFH